MIVKCFLSLVVSGSDLEGGGFNLQRLKSRRANTAISPLKIHGFYGQKLSSEDERYTQHYVFWPKTSPKHFLNYSKTTLKKVQNMTFSTPWMLKNHPQKCQKSVKFWSKISISRDHLSTTRAENTRKVGLLRTKSVPKHFLFNSRATWRKSRIRLFRPPKW